MAGLPNLVDGAEPRRFTADARPMVVWLILTYKRPQSILTLLDSITLQSGCSNLSQRFVIWDNEAVSETARQFSASKYANDLRFYFLRSRTNIKMRAKHAMEDWLFSQWTPGEEDWVVHVDDDVRFSRRWLKIALESAQSNGWDASGSTETWDGRLVLCGQETLLFDELNGRKSIWRWQFQDVSPRGQPMRVIFASHRALLVRGQTAFHTRHDPRMLIGGEDLDYSLALARDGAVIGIHPKARIEHRAGGEVDAPDFRVPNDVLYSWRLFYQKWGFVRANAASEAQMAEGDWFRAIYQAKAQ